jgi:hypothetical protein
MTGTIQSPTATGGEPKTAEQLHLGAGDLRAKPGPRGLIVTFGSVVPHGQDLLTAALAARELPKAERAAEADEARRLR